MVWTIPLMLGVAHAEFPTREPGVASLPPTVPTTRTTPRGLEAAGDASLICRCGKTYRWNAIPKYCSCSARLHPKAPR